MAGEIAQLMTILQGDCFEGPYETVRKFYNPLKMYTGDFALHVDAETKKAYIWFERPHFQMICATLTDDYTGVTDEYSIHYDGLLPPRTREAPTLSVSLFSCHELPAVENSRKVYKPWEL